ncbi:DUF4367 domain-containing protein [Oscillibacter sp.]|uniref:DUF4367 domain-containing protein n=1 Tax=Oscillibacter sp. TaxID=1945593 RepID=UPI0033920B70
MQNVSAIILTALVRSFRAPGGVGSVNVHQKPQASVQEKDDSQVTVYTAGGIDHYIMENNEVLTATWFADNLECSIMGEISESDMEAMISSINEE